MWPFRRRKSVPGPERPPEPAGPPPDPGPGEGRGPGSAASLHPMTGEELEAFFREQDRLWDELDAEIARLGAWSPRDRDPVDLFRCPACGVYGEHLLDRDGFPAECRGCDLEGGAV